jgi:hypothetical protein
MAGHSTERISLGTFPTPLEPAPRLAAAVGLREDRLWIKRDDLTGLGGGGNKVRKLERTLAAALRDGADCLVTTGAAQSNHARLTAAAGARLGLPVTLVLAGRPGEAPEGNPAARRDLRRAYPVGGRRRRHPSRRRRRRDGGRARVGRRAPGGHPLRRQQPRRRPGLRRRRP